MPRHKCTFMDELHKKYPCFHRGRYQWKALCRVAIHRRQYRSQEKSDWGLYRLFWYLTFQFKQKMEVVLLINVWFIKQHSRLWVSLVLFGASPRGWVCLPLFGFSQYGHLFTIPQGTYNGIARLKWMISLCIGNYKCRPTWLGLAITVC